MNEYNSIIKGLNEAIDYEKGKIKTRKHVIHIKPLKDYEAKKIKKIRQSVNLSQTAFASVIGVSKKTVEAWESGRNLPQGSSKRMLELLEENPDIVKNYLITEK